MEKIGKYEITRKLATGGMAEVFLAKAVWAMGLERTVVVKRILPHLAEADPTFAEMFLSEAKLASQLSHPNIVQVFDFGVAEGAYYLAMEYVDGPSLKTLAARAAKGIDLIPLHICAKIVSSACEALAYAHDLTDPRSGLPLQIVHRDISPDNILISRHGAVKVADFGIAKAVTQRHHTKTGFTKGKLAYMAPEQLESKQPIDRRADVYALGTVLYRIVSGARPYDTNNEFSLMRAILYGLKVPIRERRPDVPAELEQIIGKAMECDRDKRYADCREMYTDLERYLIAAWHEPIGPFQIAQLIADLDAAPVAPQDTPPDGMATPSRESRALKTPHRAGQEEGITRSGRSVEPALQARTDDDGAGGERSRGSIAPAAPYGTGTLGALIQALSPDWEEGPRRRAGVAAIMGAVLVLGSLVGWLLWHTAKPNDVSAAKTTDEWAQARAESDAKGNLDLAQRALDGNYLDEAANLLARARGTVLYAAEYEKLKAKIDQAKAAAGDQAKVAAADQAKAAAADQTKAQPVAAGVKPRAKEAMALLDQGIQLLKRRQYFEARDVLYECTQVDETMARCYMYLGSAYAKLYELGSAALAYRKFVELAPGDPLAPSVRKMLGEFEATGRNAFEKAEALTEAQPAAAQMPPAAKAATELLDEGIQLMKRRQYPQARDVLLQCLKLDQTMARCHMYLGSSYAKMRDLQTAAKHYRLFLQKAPDDPLAPRVREMLLEFEKTRP